MPPTHQSLSAKPSKTSKPAGKRAALSTSGRVQPLSGSPAHISQLQRQYGNRAVQQLLQRAQAEESQREAAVEARPNLIGLEGGPVGAELQSRINSARGGGQPLDKTVGSQMGRAMGAEFSRVKVHTDSQSDSLNRSLGAKAFTLGSDVFFSQGAYSPSTHSGRQLLAHELTHTLQQGAAPLQRQAIPLAAEEVRPHQTGSPGPAHGVTGAVRAGFAQRVGSDSIIQRVLPMKSQGTPASRTDGAANVIQDAVQATIDGGDEAAILIDMAHLRLSINNREAGLKAGDKLAGHQYRIEVEKGELARLQAKADVIKENKRIAAAAAAAKKAEAKNKKKGAKEATRQAAEQQAAEEQQQAKAAREKKKADQKANYEAAKLSKNAKTETGTTDEATPTTEDETQKKATAEGYRASLLMGTAAAGAIVAMAVYIATTVY